jgi:RNA polymerase sigma-70 factor (ECF subfamily)
MPLVARAQDGDAQAFCELVQPYQPRLTRYALALCGDPCLADDLTQQTLLEAWRSLRRYSGACRLSTWLHAILIHRHHKHLRTARSRPIAFSRLAQTEARNADRMLEHAASEDPDPAEAAARDEQSARLRSLVARLPEKQRVVILLRFFQAASLAEIAAAAGCSIGTVKSRLHHALAKLERMNLQTLERDQWT